MLVIATISFLVLLALLFTCLSTCSFFFRMWMLLQLYTTLCRVLLFLALVVVECEYNILYYFILKSINLLIYSYESFKLIFIVVPSSSLFLTYEFWGYFTLVYINLLPLLNVWKNVFEESVWAKEGFSWWPWRHSKWIFCELRDTKGDVSWTLACHHGFHATSSYLSSACFC